ncbi:helix-turn-helix transcriptional regulator [Endozoicomonas sp. 4G]|uniref:helix-turn-helix domain-containing protein n=1 Tax=Endozoicomonas sp. 4G TaxID=2872754 RepID=UPI002078D90C|nr:helix-turn-helix transcriptional regulator [Endozoicomonas sp. 4G]
MDWRDRVIDLMQKKGIKTRVDLGNRAGISGGSLNMALNGTHELKLTTMEKLATALGTTTRWLLYGDEMVEARQVPYLETGKEVLQFMTAEICPEPCRYIQIVHDLNITNRAFAWRSRNNDMEPVFEVGDVLIIDLCKQDNIQINRPTYVMVAEGRGRLDNQNVLRHEDNIVFYIRKLTDSAGRLHFEPVDKRYPVIPHKPLKGNENDEPFSFITGIVIQRITTYMYEHDH